MALIDDIKQVCARLAPHGWRELLLQHGLDITASDLAAELTKELPTINRNLKGFEDFSQDGRRALEPGSPARSLLYHALASTAVHPTANGQPATDTAAYPTLTELDTVENYIYSLTNRTLSNFPGAVIAVFACQYRVGSRSPNQVHADMAFSRTGVSRVGTAPANYDAARRGFWVEPTDASDKIAVMPARYGAFLAMERSPSSEDAVLDALPRDRFSRFLFPVHKLFPGEECLRGFNLTLEFLEYHRNEKLKRLHTEQSQPDSLGRIPILPGFDLNNPPFVRDSRNANDLVRLQPVKASVLVVPQDHPRLVRTATQRNSQAGREELVRFNVPEESSTNRFWTSYQILANGAGREAPEYVNIRHRVETNPTGEQRLVDLNQVIADENEFLRVIRFGGYEAAHFIDDTCDGCIVVKVNGLPQTLSDRPAYSLVTAPDFFPLADQIDIERWVKSFVPRLRDHFSQGGPSPLSEGRQPANPEIERPDSPTQKAFQSNDTTITAVVGPAPLAQTTPSIVPGANVLTSFLPDAASNVFAPGWDISLGQDRQGQVFYTAYGLGSPFPEDAKLCAALNSFWPAVAPDAARTFGLLFTPTAMPMLDGELGYHPDHPRVRKGEVTSRPGWDGEYGPFFEMVNGRQTVNFANADRSDYITNALAGQIRVNGLARVDNVELIQRMEVLRLCIRVLPPNTDVVQSTPLFLVVAEKIEDWSSRLDRASSTMQGPGYLYEFATVAQSQTELTQDVRRKRFPALDRFTCQISQNGLHWRQNQGIFNFVRRSPMSE